MKKRLKLIREWLLLVWGCRKTKEGLWFILPFYGVMEIFAIAVVVYYHEQWEHALFLALLPLVVESLFWTLVTLLGVIGALILPARYTESSGK